MPLDTFICGQCEGNFYDIQTFITHKKECDPATSVAMTKMIVDGLAPSRKRAVEIDEDFEYTAVSHRGRGRPRKDERKHVLRIVLSKKKIGFPNSDAHYRGRGRPRKGEEKRVKKGYVYKKVGTGRGRGRPRKEEKSVQSIVRKTPKKSGHGRGRPRKGGETVSKYIALKEAGKLPTPNKGQRGRGRPRKFPKKEKAVSSKSISDKPSKGRGRPRKFPKEDAAVQSNSEALPVSENEMEEAVSNDPATLPISDNEKEMVDAPNNSVAASPENSRRGRGRPPKPSKETVPNNVETLPVSDNDDAKNGEVSPVED